MVLLNQSAHVFALALKLYNGRDNNDNKLYLDGHFNGI